MLIRTGSKRSNLPRLTAAFPVETFASRACDSATLAGSVDLRSYFHWASASEADLWIHTENLSTYDSLLDLIVGTLWVGAGDVRNHIQILHFYSTRRVH
jgi:hypothetical protein